MSETTPSQSLEETLNKTDLGQVIYEKKLLIGGLLAAVLVVVIGWMAISNFKLSQQRKGSALVFEFQNEFWEKAKAGSISVDELIAGFNSLDESAKSSASILPLALEMSKFLAEKNASKEALELLSGVKASNSLSRFFITHQKTVFLENEGKIDEAISVIEEAKKSKELLMPAYLELVLGRLYLVKKNFNEAKAVFESIITTYPNDEEAKIAKLYLGEIK